MRFIGIDPSTKTGLVILDEQGNVIESKEITTDIKTDPARFIDLATKVLLELPLESSVVIEGFSFGSRGNAVSIQYGVGWCIRTKLYEMGFYYTEVSPSALKKFVGGKSNTKKDELAVEIYKRWGFEHKSDNVRDAYVLAQIARYKHLQLDMTKFQREVIDKLGA